MGFSKLFFGVCCFAVIIIFHASQATVINNPNQGFIDEQNNNPIQGFLEEHNKARAEVGVGPMTWSNTVALYAQKYAESKIETCEMKLSGGPYGEALAEGFGEMTAAQAVKFWVTSEKPNYDYASNECVNGECLIYTQVVWRDTVHLGCARVKCKNGRVLVVCNYDPPGNIEGERPY